MAVAPTGPLSLPIDAVRQMIAGSVAFQAWTSSATVTAALERVHITETDVTSDNLPAMPYALVDYSGWQQDKYGVTPGSWIQAESSVTVFFRAQVQDDEPADEFFRFANQVGAIIEDMQDTAGDYTAQTLPAYQISMTIAPTRKGKQRRAARGDYYEAQFQFDFARKVST